MSSTDVPSVDCDCRRKSIRNVRIITSLVVLCTAIVREVAFAYGTVAHAVLGITIGAAALVYGITTMFDETATFPKWLYGVIAGIGGLVAANAISHLL